MTWSLLDKQKDYVTLMIEAERVNAYSFPVFEDQYMSHSFSPYTLYETFVPERFIRGLDYWIDESER